MDRFGLREEVHEPVGERYAGGRCGEASGKEDAVRCRPGSEDAAFHLVRSVRIRPSAAGLHRENRRYLEVARTPTRLTP